MRSCHVLCAPPTNTTIWPGGFLEVEVPTDFPSDTQLAIEPRVDSSSCRLVKSSHAWPQPNILHTVGGKLRLVNPSDEPILIKKNDHLDSVLSPNEQVGCYALLKEFDHVFDSTIPG